MLFLLSRQRRITRTRNHSCINGIFVNYSKPSTHGLQLKCVLHCHCMYLNTQNNQCSIPASFSSPFCIELFSYLSFLPSDLSIQSVLWTTKLTFSHLLPLHDEMALAATASINPSPPTPNALNRSSLQTKLPMQRANFWPTGFPMISILLDKAQLPQNPTTISRLYFILRVECVCWCVCMHYLTLFSNGEER